MIAFDARFYAAFGSAPASPFPTPLTGADPPIASSLNKTKQRNELAEVRRELEALKRAEAAQVPTRVPHEVVHPVSSPYGYVDHGVGSSTGGNASLSSGGGARTPAANEGLPSVPNTTTPLITPKPITALPPPVVAATTPSTANTGALPTFWVLLSCCENLR